MLGVVRAFGEQRRRLFHAERHRNVGRVDHVHVKGFELEMGRRALHEVVVPVREQQRLAQVAHLFELVLVRQLQIVDFQVVAGFQMKNNMEVEENHRANGQKSY